MSEKFNTYISDIIELTFGFKPIVRIEIPNEGVVKIFLDGTEGERKQMMGYHACNFHALKQLLICFSKKYNVYVFLYLEFSNESYQPQYQGPAY